MSKDDFIEGALTALLHRKITLIRASPCAGGCINEAIKAETDQGVFFMKWNEAKTIDFFQKECTGLNALRSTKTVNTPEVIAVGLYHDIPCLILSFIPSTKPDSKYWETLGQQLALLHRHSNTSFGFHQDNYIGALPQQNTPCDRWTDFFIQQRLEPQLSMALEAKRINQEEVNKIRKTYKHLDTTVPKESPALTHGDLWSGNIICNTNSSPYLIDPATHFNHRETELAFTTMFGGFDQRFYEAYHEAYPLTKGFSQRKTLYNLYPLLVHLNLFGNAYLPPILETARKYS